MYPCKKGIVIVFITCMEFVVSMKNSEKISYASFSPKQKMVLNWWKSPISKSKDGIICDGAVRSGKTVCMMMSFIMWASVNYNNQSFGICGKTIASVRRNLITPLINNGSEWGFEIKDFKTKNYLDISLNGVINRFYIFGGKDEGSASLIQGMTLAGVLMDEVVLMPRSFVEQAVARCSVTGSKLWFNCNPESRFHWFKSEWIDKSVEKNLIYLHFSLEDNPSLSQNIIKRYKTLYSGPFYQRFVLGRWTNTAGSVYSLFDPKIHVVNTLPESFSRYAISCDYGTVNPSSFGLWGQYKNVWYRIDEYYYNSKETGIQRTDEEHYKALEKLGDDRDIEIVICDPSAASFMECIRRHGRFTVAPAKNDVLSGIRRVNNSLSTGKIKIYQSCKDAIREFSLYRWDSSNGIDCPVKEDDHAMDDIRYFVTHFLKEQDDFFVMSLSR